MSSSVTKSQRARVNSRRLLAREAPSDGKSSVAFAL